MKTRNSLKVYSFASIAVVLVIAGILNYLQMGTYRRADLTRDRIYSSSPEVQAIIKKLGDKATVTFVQSASLPAQFIAPTRFLRDSLDELRQSSGGKIDTAVRIVGDDPKEEAELRKFGIERVPVGTIERDQRSYSRIYFHLLVQYGPKFDAVPILDETSLDYTLAQSLLKVQVKEKPVIVCIQNDPKFDFIPAVERIRSALGIDDRFQLVTYSATAEDPVMIPPSADMLILGKPVDLTPRELYEIDQYLMNGGHVVVFAEPLPFANPMADFDRKVLHYNLYDQLRAYGVDVQNALVEDYGSNLSVRIGDRAGIAGSAPNPAIPIAKDDSFSSQSIYLAKTRNLALPFAAPVVAKPEGEGFEVEVLMRSTAKSALQTGSFDVRPRMGRNVVVPADTKSYPIAVTVSGPFRSVFAGQEIPPPPEGTTATAMYRRMSLDTKGLPQNDVALEGSRLTVFGSGHMYSQRFLENLIAAAPAVGEEQIAFFLNFLEANTLGADLLSIRRKQIQTPLFREDLTDAERRTARLASTAGLPLLVGLLGLLAWVVRRASLARAKRRFA